MSYTNPNNEIKYIHRYPNYPPRLIRKIPPSTESRLSTLSYNEKNISRRANSLPKSIAKLILTYKWHDNNSPSIIKRKQNEKQQWSIPPSNIRTKTKIDKLVLNLLNKHFPPHNKLHRLI